MGAWRPGWLISARATCGQSKLETWLCRLATNEALQLEKAMSHLEPELRAVLLLKEQRGLSYQEIAESVAIPEGTVGSRLNRARKELRQELTKLGWD